MDTASIPYEYFIGQTFKLVDNDSYYVYDEETGKYENNVGIGKAKSDGSEGSSGFNPLSDSESKKLLWSYDDSSESQTLLKQMYDASGEEIKVVGVIRAKKMPNTHMFHRQSVTRPSLRKARSKAHKTAYLFKDNLRFPQLRTTRRRPFSME